MSLFGDLFMGGINAAVGAANNAQAQYYTRQNMLYGYQLNEKAAQAADARTRKLYGDFYSPEAQMKQLKEAGLSPSIFYGGTPGQGGANGAMGGTHAIAAPYAPVSMLEGAQVANLLAQAEKTKAETKQIEPLANATVSSLLADAGYKDAAAKAAEAQAAGQKLHNYITEQTTEASIYTICELADKAGDDAEAAYYAMKDAKLLNQFNQETFEDRKKTVHVQMEQIVQSIAESKSTQHLNEQQKKYLKDQILENITKTELEWSKYNLSVEQFETFIDKQIPILQGQLEATLKELDIKQKQMIINAVTETFKGLAMGAMAASSMGVGKGGNLTPTPQQAGLKTKHSGGNALNKGVPVYKQNSVWEY